MRPLSWRERLRTVVLPAIGVGVKDFNRVAAAHTALGAVRDFLDARVRECDSPDGPDFKVVLVLLDIEHEVLYNELLPIYFPPHQPQLRASLQATRHGGEHSDQIMGDDLDIDE